MRSLYLSLLLLTTILCLSVTRVYAQTESDERALLEVKNGLSFSKDTLFLLNLRFRMQNRLGATTKAGDDLRFQSVEGRVRRLRLRFDGYALSPKLSYYVQLSFSKADQDLEEQSTPQTVRDAMVFYTFSKNFYIGVGQTKLPGNRERVVSSGNLQFADRSIVNSQLTIDRDFGVFAYYTVRLPQNALFQLKGALSTGEGRNSSTYDNKVAYTGRIEFLPFGAFKNTGDYSEGDLERESSPKLSIAGTYHRNNGARRERGALGDFLMNPRDLTSVFADVMFKYKGFATLAEYMSRQTGNPVVSIDPSNLQYVYAGYGFNFQPSYLLKSNWEIAGRYSLLVPDEKISPYESQRQVVGIGTTRYLNGHRIKAQSHVFYQVNNGDYSFGNPGNSWNIMLQVEFGI